MLEDQLIRESTKIWFFSVHLFLFLSFFILANVIRARTTSPIPAKVACVYNELQEVIIEVLTERPYTVRLAYVQIARVLLLDNLVGTTDLRIAETPSKLIVVFPSSNIVKLVAVVIVVTFKRVVKTAVVPVCVFVRASMHIAHSA